MGTLDNFDYFGFSAASLGDLNGDGVSDLAVGAVGDDDGGENRGALWILFLDGGKRPQDKDQQRCINALNKSFAKVARARGKAITRCIKDGSKGNLSGQDPIETCLAGNNAKVENAKQRTNRKYDAQCVPADPPDFGPTNPDTVNQAAMEKELSLIRAIFGSDLDAVIVRTDDPGRADARAEARCQVAAAEQARKCQHSKLMTFIACKKDGLNGARTGNVYPGADDPFDSPDDLEGCMDFDLIPKATNRTSKACDPKLGRKLSFECEDLDIPSLFPGECGSAQDPTELKDCFERLVECHVCQELNQADALNRNCDEFDNDAADGSCPPASPACGDGVVNQPTEECDDGNNEDGDGCAADCMDEFCGDGIANDRPNEWCDGSDDGLCPGECQLDCTCSGPIAIGEHKCVFDPAASSINLEGTPLPFPPFPAVGAIDIDCGVPDPNSGKTSCDCVLQELEPIEVIGIGYLCFTAGAPCPPGEIDCDGGNGLDVVMDSDHNIGTCTSSADCEAQCAAHCAAMGAVVFNEACEGFCEGGTRDTLPCTDDSDCPGGSCGGTDGLYHGNICGCECLTVGGAPSVVGGLQCNLGVTINVEIGAPCGDGDVLIAMGTRCIPLSTETVSSQFHNWNNMPGSDWPVPPFTATGNPIPCRDLAASITSGITMVGTVNFFDTTIGDYHTNEIFVCF
jgi:cysteine-rich repeat protein